MIDRVALAISGGNDPSDVLEIHRSRARVAIEAMRFPDPQTVARADNKPRGLSWNDCMACWNAILDEALK